jgi:hypothetical protein
MNQSETYWAILVVSSISRGWATKRLFEKELGSLAP